MVRKISAILFVAIFFATGLSAQVPMVWEPDISLSGNIIGQWSWNTKFVARFGMGQLGEGNHSDAGRLLLAEAQGFINRRLVGGRRITLGFLYGVEEPLDQASTEKRIIWQYSYRTPTANWSLAHRARIEQRFFEESFQHRLRYRIVAERPLQGDKLDAGEFYFFAGSEFLFSSDERIKNLRLDNRSGLGIGMLFANEHRLQFELQHRAQRLFDERYGSRLWLLTSWVVPL
jgi:hypothetical protein